MHILNDLLGNQWLYDCGSYRCEEGYRDIKIFQIFMQDSHFQIFSIGGRLFVWKDFAMYKEYILVSPTWFYCCFHVYVCLNFFEPGSKHPRIEGTHSTINEPTHSISLGDTFCIQFFTFPCTIQEYPSFDLQIKVNHFLIYDRKIVQQVRVGIVFMWLERPFKIEV